jgi:hypothetical protein
VRKIDDPPIRDAALRFVGEAIIDIYIHVIRPILKIYPDLDPERER